MRVDAATKVSFVDALKNGWMQQYRRTKVGRPVYAYAQPYRDPFGKVNEIPMWQKDMAQWCNKRMIFCTMKFEDFSPRKGFICKEYFK